ncbi:uncharacterized protein CTHT_0030310 [Thermochaetoides thermophila DSM 1495]|uniref:Thioesterase domain-containing protein n=1 Tax=Chaetomium thermophilum (strain DSM 1495 / CBS 144.50 / IMI 039719) TaxID=759272 RepID=G0S3R1_CHATD|nr:hypothetical protein CTHT_0030310 [Thermochaetoides thermophila DSM 1495]EGS21187.1 hypothetical protein CTHT_0030310 [Thermochaetoides thermophila DSM 1495]
MAQRKDSKPAEHADKFLKMSDEERIKVLLEEFAQKKDDDWSSHLLPSLTLHSITPASPPTRPYPLVTFKFTVHPTHCNRLRNLHGGCAATLFDFCTSIPLALVARPGFWSYLGVSRTLNVTYLRPAPEGSTVLVECEIVGVGKRLCTVRGTMRRVEDGTVLMVCEHGKVNTDPDVASKL